MAIVPTAVGTRWSRALLAALSALLLCACDSAIVPPDLNPHPTKWVTLRVFAPSSLKLRLAELWAPNRHPFGTVAACNLQGGMKKPLYVPVTLRWDGTSYVGGFLEDRYLPSRCDWGFMGIMSTSPSLDGAVMYMEFPVPAFPTVNESDRRSDLWCGINPAPPPPEVCIFLGYFAKYSHHFPQAWRALVAAQDAAAVTPPNFRFDHGQVVITPNAKYVELHYHDYDAEARAANGNQ